MAFRLVITIKQRVCLSFHALQKRFQYWVKPPTASFLLGTLADFARGKSELIAENALLRQQLIILHRQLRVESPDLEKLAIAFPATMRGKRKLQDHIIASFRRFATMSVNPNILLAESVYIS